MNTPPYFGFSTVYPGNLAPSLFPLVLVLALGLALGLVFLPGHRTQVIVQLLIIDDFLLTPLSDWERRDLLEIAEDRYQSGATVITSQCPISDWHPNVGDPTLADAICDRLLHNAYKMELKGDSMRRNSESGKSEKRAKGGDLQTIET